MKISNCKIFYETNRGKEKVRSQQNINIPNIFENWTDEDILLYLRYNKLNVRIYSSVNSIMATLESKISR